MPDTTTYGGDPIPTGPEGAWVPGSLMAYAESIDPKLVQAATSQADRDARLSTLPAGSLVTCAPLKTVWLKTGTSSWTVAANDTGWVTAGFSYPDGNWSALYAQVRNLNGTVCLAGRFVYAGPDVTAGPYGAFPTQTMANLPAAFRSATVVTSAGSGPSGYPFNLQHSSAGDLNLLAGPPGYTLASGAACYVSNTYCGS